MKEELLIAGAASGAFISAAGHWEPKTLYGCVSFFTIFLRHFWINEITGPF